MLADLKLLGNQEQVDGLQHERFAACFKRILQVDTDSKVQTWAFLINEDFLMILISGCPIENFSLKSEANNMCEVKIYQ
jgi:hypothetical protein